MYVIVKDLFSFLFIGFKRNEFACIWMIAYVFFLFCDLERT